MSSPVLYVVAGPNGIGKTTAVFSILPRSVPVINSDEIAKQVKSAGLAKVSVQEYSNREAQRLVQEHIEAKNSFGIETNLADEETWKFLKGMKGNRLSCSLVLPLNQRYKPSSPPHCRTGASRRTFCSARYC